MQILAVRHLDPATRQPIGDSYHTLSPAADHGGWLRFLLEGFDGWPLAVGVFDPDVNAAGQHAAQQREARIEPPDAGYPPQVAAALWHSAMRRSELVSAELVAQMVEQGVEDVDVLVR